MTNCCLPELRERNHEILRLRLEERLRLSEIVSKIGGLTRQRVQQIISKHMPDGGSGREIVQERFTKIIKCGNKECNKTLRVSIHSSKKCCSHSCTIQANRKFPFIDGKPTCQKCGDILFSSKRPFLCRKHNTERAKEWRNRPGNMKRIAEIAKRSENKDLRKRKVWSAVNYALRTGHLIKPATCDQCTSTFIQAHHDDYNEPLKVKWLCALHHKQRHIILRATQLSTV